MHYDDIQKNRDFQRSDKIRARISLLTLGGADASAESKITCHFHVNVDH